MDLLNGDKQLGGDKQLKPIAKRILWTTVTAQTAPRSVVLRLPIECQLFWGTFSVPFWEPPSLLLFGSSHAAAEYQKYLLGQMCDSVSRRLNERDCDYRTEKKSDPEDITSFADWNEMFSFSRSLHSFAFKAEKRKQKPQLVYKGITFLFIPRLWARIVLLERKCPWKMGSSIN